MAYQSEEYDIKTILKLLFYRIDMIDNWYFGVIVALIERDIVIKYFI